MNKNLAPVVFSAENLNLTIGEDTLLNDASLTVHEKERVGLVGRNGCGKSLFLKIINRLDSPHSGNIMFRKNLTSSYLPQEFTLDDSLSVYECIKTGAAGIRNLIKKFENLPPDSPEAHVIEEKLQKVDAWNIDVRVNRFITELNISSPAMNVKKLSGGEKRRVALAKTIVSMPELLILDEPTNHLDTESIEWLEKYIRTYYGTVIFVTHDRYFLDNLSDRIVELSQGKFYSYEGDYTDFIQQKTKREELEERAELKRQNFLRREIKWIRSSPKARTGKSKSRIDRFEKAADALPPEKELDMELIIPKPLRLGNNIAEMKNITFAFNDRIIVNEFNYSFKHGDKIGLVGRNGSGKTTLLKILQQQILPDSGEVKLSDNVVFNYIDQERLKLNEENTVYDEIGEGYTFIKLGNINISIWSYLKRFLFEDSRIKTKIKYLSGGEKGRLILAKLLRKQCNFIILDEPTNDLDLQTLRILEEALTMYKGCVILVSHDRYFMDRVCNGIISLDGRGNVNYYLGNYFYYREKHADNGNKQYVSATKDKKQKKKVKTPTKKLSWKEERELQTMEDRLLEAEEQINELEKKFSDPDFFKKYSAEAETMKKELNNLKDKQEYLFNRWEELEKK